MPFFQLVTLILVALTLFYYAWCGLQEWRSISRAEEYLLVSRHLSRRDYMNTFVATSTSLATALTFFFSFGSKFGLALIISPIMFSIGVLVFRRMTLFMNADGFFQNGTTLHQYILSKYDSTTTKNVATTISLLGYLGIFVIELYVGVSIFTAFSHSLGWQVFIAIVLLALMFFYIFLGGYPAVIKTDVVQIRLVVLGLALLLLTLIAAATARELWSDILQTKHLNPLPTVLPWHLLIVMVVGNVPFQMLKMSNWHRAAASGNLDETRSALMRGWCVTFVIWFAAALCGIIGGVIATNAGTEDFDLNEAFNLLANSIGQGAGQTFCRYVVYPLLFCGCVAALVSTADSVFVPILATYVFDMRFQGQNIEASEQVSRDVLTSTRKVVVLFLLAGVGLYVLLTYVLKLQFIHLLFIFFNQQLVLFPVVWFALMNDARRCRDCATSATLSMIVAAIATWALAIYGGAKQRDDLVMWSSTVGFMGSILLFYAFNLKAALKLSVWRRLKTQE